MKNKANKPLILLDLDGTIADFSATVALHFGIELPLKIPEGLYPWIGDGAARKELNRMMESYKFWRDLEPYSWAKEMLQTIEKYGEVYFLSKARPNAGCMGGKMDWVKFRFPHMENKLILTTQDKFPCANGNILIDDDLRHEPEWSARGGKFFHWIEIKDCQEGVEIYKKRIVELEKFLEERA